DNDETESDTEVRRPAPPAPALQRRRAGGGSQHVRPSYLTEPSTSISGASAHAHVVSQSTSCSMARADRRRQALLAAMIRTLLHRRPDPALLQPSGALLWGMLR